VRIRNEIGGFPIVASATMPGGSILIGFSSNNPSRRVILRSVTAGCAPDPAFGRMGTSTLVIPRRLARPPAKYPLGAPKGSLWVSALAPRRGGGAVLLGAYGDRWVVGAITRRGQLDRSFGDNGWTVLPFHGEATAAVQEPSGEIVIAGDNGGAGCCVVNWATAVTAGGQLDRTFGKHGRAGLPTGEDSGVFKLAIEPDGDVLAAVGYGNSGCWGLAPAMLTPAGQPAPHFAGRLQRFWRRLHLSAFVGDVYVDGDGFLLEGTGQRPCAGMPSLASAPSARGLIARFRTDGSQIGKTIRFRSRLFGESSSFPYGNDILVVQAPYAQPARLRVIALRPDGSLDSRFANRGRARIRTPWKGSQLEATVSVEQAGARVIVLLAVGPAGQVQLIRLAL
jgi:hypothetical protein